MTMNQTCQVLGNMFCMRRCLHDVIEYTLTVRLLFM